MNIRALYPALYLLMLVLHFILYVYLLFLLFQVSFFFNTHYLYYYLFWDIECIFLFIIFIIIIIIYKTAVLQLLNNFCQWLTYPLAFISSLAIILIQDYVIQVAIGIRLYLNSRDICKTLVYHYHLFKCDSDGFNTTENFAMQWVCACKYLISRR